MRSHIVVSCLLAFAAVACSDNRGDPVSEASPADRPAVPVPAPIAVGRYCAVEAVEGLPAPAQVDSDGKVFVSFEDGWNNRGLATLAPSGALTLAIVTPSPDQANANIGRAYGDFQLTKEACARIRPIG